MESTLNISPVSTFLISKPDDSDVDVMILGPLIVKGDKSGTGTINPKLQFSISAACISSITSA